MAITAAVFRPLPARCPARLDVAPETTDDDVLSCRTPHFGQISAWRSIDEPHAWQNLVGLVGGAGGATGSPLSGGGGGVAD